MRRLVFGSWHTRNQIAPVSRFYFIHGNGEFKFHHFYEVEQDGLNPRGNLTESGA